MLRISIENGTLMRNGHKVKLEECQLNNKVKEVFAYFISNNIDLNLEKREQHISFSAVRPDLKARLINALMADRLVRHHGVAQAA